MSRRVSALRIIAATGLVLLAARWGRTGSQTDPEDPTATLEVAVVRGDDGRPTPARVYLFKDDKPFRLSPVDVLLPLRVDLFYRERLWRRPPDPPRRDRRPARTLEVTNDGDSHFVLLDGEGRYELPAGNYRVEAYHGTSWEPASEAIVLRASERRRLTLTLRPLDGGSGRGWVSGDDHIHLTRAAEDDEVFLRWL